MAFDDLPLSRPPAPEPPARRPSQSSTSRWVIVGAGTVVAGVALTLWWMSRAQPPAVIPSPTSPTNPTTESRRPKPQPLQLPSLPDSDAMLREAAVTLSRNPLLARLVATRGLVRNATLAIVQIGDGKTPAAPLGVLRPPVRLQIAGQQSGRVEAASFARWEAATSALLSVPPSDLARVYVNVKELFDEAYRDLGYPNGDFDVALSKAIRVIVTTPPAPPDMILLRREGYFEHVDSTLGSLQPVQKQLLLFGPTNQARVQSWLRQLAAALELKIGD
jgi:hypothetical protein